ncbi:hypothetical protein KKD52_00730 [Myxococcota bacterium]|nr:hypothetical protein [Myxococcota bacterium]
MIPRSIIFGFFSALLLLMVAAGCDDPARSPRGAENDFTDWEDVGLSVLPNPRLDLVIVNDNSLGTADAQITFQGDLGTWLDSMKRFPGGLPDLHVGVITTDLGSAPYNIAGCETPGGDGGRFLKGVANVCVTPENQLYIVDVEPRGCTIQKTMVPGEATLCPAHDCVQANCEPEAFTEFGEEAMEPAGLVLHIDETGCPRCRNTGDAGTLESLACTTSVGSSGCGFEQPLEALKLALTNRTAHEGFFRDDATLAVLFLIDEDDCSVKQSEFFDPTGDTNSELGVLTSFRCTEFGVVCDEPWDRTPGCGLTEYHNCRPREAADPDSLLFPISSYANLIHQLMDEERFIAVAIAGPYGDTLEVTCDTQMNAKLMNICDYAREGANPAVRLQAFVQQFHTWPVNLQWPFRSICETTYAPALTGMVHEFFSRTARRQPHRTCVRQALYGCPDPSFANGGEKTSTLPDELAAVCVPECEVQLEDEWHTPVPPCDPAYADGHPDPIDPELPVEACFHVVHDPLCHEASAASLAVATGNAVATGAQFVISRRTIPDWTPGASFRCRALPPRELTCRDGFDNDQDGLTDKQDPDCAN